MRKFFNSWVIATLLLYYFGPIAWQGAEHLIVAGFVLSSLTAYNLGYLLVSHDISRRYSSFGFGTILHNRYTALLILVVHLVLSAYITQHYTGRSIFSQSSWSMEFGLVYNEYQESIYYASAGTAVQLAILLKALIFPLAVIVFCDRFRSKIIYPALFLFPMLGSSFMRGTDKEIFDIMIVVLICSYYYGVFTRLVFFAATLIPLAFYLFIEHKLGRFDGAMPECLPDADVCFNFDGALGSNWPSLEIARVMGTNYLTQGYEGLSQAFTLPFVFNGGIGHLPPIKSSLCGLFDVGCDVRDYQDRLSDVGWNTANKWASVYTVLANDFHWTFVPLYLFLVGRLHHIAEIEWYERRNPVALGSLIMIAVFFIYSSANMQIAISLDWALATIFLIYLPLLLVRSGRRQTTLVGLKL